MKKIPLPFRLFKNYVRLISESIYYKEIYVQGIENLPPEGTATIVASNHQNSMNDALAIQMAINDRKPYFIVRGDIFGVNPLLSRFLTALGLLPAFRLNQEGVEAMKQNSESFSAAERAVAEGETLVIFPEGGHAWGHWLCMFKSGMAKMALDAASQTDFKKEIYIVPVCNHYSSYCGIRVSLIVRFGEKIPVSPFYELYREKPRTAERKLTELVRSGIEKMVLDQKDKEFYNEMEYLRQGKAGAEFANASGYDPSDFPQRFESDKIFIKRFLEARHAENACFKVVKVEEGMSVEDCALKQIEEQNAAKAAEATGQRTCAEAESLLLDVRAFLSEIKKAGLSDCHFDNRPQLGKVLLRSALLILLLPLALFCLWPSAFCWFIPKAVNSRVRDKMFEGTFLIGLNVLIILPLAAVITLVAVSMKFTLLLALIHILMFPAILLFEWHYCQAVKETVALWRWLKARSRGITKKPEEMRNSILERVKAVVNY